MWFLNLFQLISVRMAHLICILGTESVQDTTKVEVNIIVEIVVFKKLKSVSEERGRKSKGRAVIFVASLKKKEITEKKKSTDAIVSIRKRKNQKEAENIRMRLEISDFHFFSNLLLEVVVCIYVCGVSFENVEFVVLPRYI